MIKILFISLVLILHTSCTFIKKDDMANNLQTELILSVMDNSIKGKYNDFFRIDDPMLELAQCQITLYKDEGDWAMVFEKIGYDQRSPTGILTELTYIGNCIMNLDVLNGETYNIKYRDHENNFFDYLTGDTKNLIFGDNRIDTELISCNSFKSLGIPLYSEKLYEGAILRFIALKQPELLRVDENVRRQCIPSNLKKIRTFYEWCEVPYHKFERNTPPSRNPFYIGIANYLKSEKEEDLFYCEEPNSHWKYWVDSGGL